MLPETPMQADMQAMGRVTRAIAQFLAAHDPGAYKEFEDRLRRSDLLCVRPERGCHPAQSPAGDGSAR